MPESAALLDPVELAANAWRATEVPSERLDALLLAFEVSVRVDALVLSAAYLRDPRWLDARARSLLRTRQLTLGQWWDLVTALASSSPRDLAVSERRDFYREMVRSGPSGDGQRLLALRNPRAHDLRRTSADFVSGALEDGEFAFKRYLSRRPRTPPLRSQGEDELVMEVGGKGLAASPLMLPGAAGTGETLPFLLGGWAGGSARWESLAGARRESAAGTRLLTALLDGKTGATEVIESSASPDLLVARVLECTRATLGRLSSLQRYRPECTVPRSEAEATVAAFCEEDRPLLVVDGPAGAGKTTFLAQLADQLLPSTIVLFEAVDRLPDPDLPQALGSVLHLKGDAGQALAAAARRSPDGRLWLLLDDAGAMGRERQLILSVLGWLERVGPATPLRIVLSIRSDRLRPFLAAHADSIPARSFRRLSLSPLEPAELLDLAARLPIPHGEEVSQTLLARRGVALRLGCDGARSVRRPGLAVPLLEASTARSVPAALSATALYERVLGDVILERGEDGHPRRPGAGRLARQIASALLGIGKTALPLSGDEAARLALIDPATGRCQADLETLLADGILRETHEDFDTWLTFADERLLEFLAATSLPTSSPAEVLSALLSQAGTFPPAMIVAGFYCCRMASLAERRCGIAEAVRGVDGTLGLLRQIAALDPRRFVEIASIAVRPGESCASALVSALVHDGEPRLAAELVDAFRGSAGSDVGPELKLLHARALYENDEYSRAAEEIDSLGAKDRSTEALALRAEIYVSRGEFEAAVGLLSDLRCEARRPDGCVLRCLGYALGRLGRRQEAEATLREAIAAIDPEAVMVLGEAWGDLGEVLIEEGRLDEAREAVEKSREISRRIPSLMGHCISLGLLGVLEIRSGRLPEAQELLEQSLELCRRISNRWREAYLLEHLAECVGKRGDVIRAGLLEREVREIRKEIDCTRPGPC